MYCADTGEYGYCYLTSMKRMISMRRISFLTICDRTETGNANFAFPEHRSICICSILGNDSLRGKRRREFPFFILMYYTKKADNLSAFCFILRHLRRWERWVDLF